MCWNKYALDALPSNTATSEVSNTIPVSNMIDQFMDSVYASDSQGFLVNGTEFPTYFSHDGLMSSMLEISPEEPYDYSHEGFPSNTMSGSTS